MLFLLSSIVILLLRVPLVFWARTYIAAYIACFILYVWIEFLAGAGDIMDAQVSLEIQLLRSFA